VAAADVEALEVVAPGAEARGRAVPVTTVLLKDGVEVARTDGSTLRYDGGSAGLPPGTYRVEVRLPVPDVFIGDHETTVVYSNRIRVRARRPVPD
jgi:hypothetical protein